MNKKMLLVYIAVLGLGTKSIATNVEVSALSKANGSVITSSFVNATSGIDAINQPYKAMNFFSSCNVTAGTAKTKPQLVSTSLGSNYFQFDLKNVSYPPNVSVTRVRWKFCYYLEGVVDQTIYVVPVYRNKITGQVTEWVSCIGPFMIVPGTYASSGNALSIQTEDWRMPTAISSTNLDNYEFGYVVRTSSGQSSTQHSVVHILGFSVSITFSPTPTTLALLPPELIYVVFENGTRPWNNNVIKVSQVMPYPPSVTGVRVSVRCMDGVFRNIGDYPSYALALSLEISINQLNSSYCAASPIKFQRNNAVMFSSQPLQFNSTPVGSTAYSGFLTLF
jgi:hypothetical protein